MIAARTIAISYALIGWLIVPPLLAQTTQTAKANGPCSAAINAAAGAKVFSKIDCAAIDAKIKAAIKKLEANGAQNTKVDLGQAQAITALKGSDVGQEERIKRLEETIAGYLINAQSPGASGEDVAIASAIERGDATAAARLVRAKADRNIKQAIKQAAQLYLQEARLLATKDVRLAIRAATDSANADPSNFVTWIELSRLHRAAGSLPQARRTAEAALQHVGDDWDRMGAKEALGDIAVVEGQLPAAHRHYQARLAASQAVLADAPDDNYSQREVSVSHNKLGDVAVVQGDLAGARTAYGASLAIRERLVASDPGNTWWQRDLSVSHNKLGDIAVAQGDLAGARTAYGAGQAIRERLAASDPGNAEWQRDLSVSHYKLGDVARAQGDLAGARTAYGASLAIFERLAASDPGNAGWQRDLSVSHEKLGDLAEARGDYVEAVRCYEASRPIAKRLAETLPDHPGFASDFKITERRIVELRARLRAK
jgi:tetratricopeptide (TPR) repeat protein